MPIEIPENMNCIEITEFSEDCDVLKVASHATPQPEDGEILIKVAAAGVNRPDLVQRRGHYPAPPGVTDIPGLEVAGEVVALGNDVDNHTIGDSVTALVAGGGYAEYCVAPAPQALPVPKGLSMVEAAAIPETFYTVWSNVFDRCGLADGETLLIHGGSSGIGTTAIMIAAALGNRVAITAGSAEKCQACLDLGAKRAINYKEEDFVEVVKEFTDGKGIDVILDMVGGDYVRRDIECLAMDGRIGVIALLGGTKAEIDVGSLLRKRQTLTGSTLRARPVAFKGKISQSLQEKVWPLMEAGKFKPVIHETVPFAQAADAHRLLEAGQHIGKIVLTF